MGRSLLILALLVLVAPVRGQAPLPGDTLTWERVGDADIGAAALAFDGAGRLYAVTHNQQTYRLDLSGGFPGVWELRSGLLATTLIGLGPDTLVAAAVEVWRSTDGGGTWVEVYDEQSSSIDRLYEAPTDTPLAGRLYVGAWPEPALSLDRGATWVPFTPIPDGDAQVFAVLPTGSAYAGRLIAGCNMGAAYSDDGGQTWAHSALWDPLWRYAFGALAVVEPPGGSAAARVLASSLDAWQPPYRARYSDDGGETWLPEGGYPLPEPADGVVGDLAGLLALGGSQALVVLGRGVVYATEDGGETWAEVGRVPGLDPSTLATTAVLGPDGRLYVGVTQFGDQWGGWTYRTQQPVMLASQPAPVSPGDGLLGLGVVPNPVRGGAATVALTLVWPAEVEAALYDVLGRRVAVLHEGPLPAGRHELPLEAGHLPPGVYVVRASTGEAAVSRRITLLR